MHRVIVPLSLLFFTAPGYAIDILTGQQSLEFHGYFRGGFGTSDHGTTQAKFQIPGSRAKYRLGNEPETNMELQLTYDHRLTEQNTRDAHLQAVIMIDDFKSHDDAGNFQPDNLAQGYLSFKQLFDSDTSIWFGRRYYDRKSIHILNHYWLNTGQNSYIGMGIEKIAAGYGELDLALFRQEDHDDANAIIPGRTTLIESTVLDLRWRDLRLTRDSRMTLWGQIATREEQSNLPNTADEKGAGIGFWIDSKAANLTNTFSLIHQRGATITQADFNPRPVRESQGWVLDDASVIEANNTLTYERLPDLSYQWALIFRTEDHGLNSRSRVNWYSTGIRPIIYFTEHTNIALEAGVDYIDDETNNRKGHLSKITAAYQISAARGFRSRPALRLFVTFSEWSDDFIGLAGTIPGDAPYGQDSQGWSTGAQLETWW